MKQTRRQFIQSIVTAGAWLALGNKAMAAMPAAGGSMTDDGQWKTIRVSDNTDMRVYVAAPANAAAKAPGIIVLQEVFGVNAYIRDVAQRFARLGFLAAAPELFHRTAPGFEAAYTGSKDEAMKNMQAMTDQTLAADLHAVYDMLKADSRTDGDRIACVGFCMGGRASFLANAELPLKAAISYYGAGIARTLLPRARDQHAPILLFYGGKDDHIGREQQNAVADALKQAGKLYTDVEFSDAGHGFFCDQRDSYNPIAARESWALASAFLKEHV